MRDAMSDNKCKNNPVGSIELDGILVLWQIIGLIALAAFTWFFWFEMQYNTSILLLLFMSMVVFAKVNKSLADFFLTMPEQKKQRDNFVRISNLMDTIGSAFVLMIAIGKYRGIFAVIG